MTEQLKQALILTGWGMGMTFISVIALVIGMYLMTILFKDNKGSIADDEGELQPDPQEAYPYEYPEMEEENNSIDKDEKFRAIAASVAVAMALSEVSQNVLNHDTRGAVTPDTWNHFVRSRHLSQRSRYEQLKDRK